MPKFNQVATLVRYAITANGNWRCPSDVTTILATGFGGGGSGGGGGTSNGGAGGGGTIQSTISITVTPGSLYAIVIGAGGTAVAASTNGNFGADTTFNAGHGVGLTGTWSGASGGGTSLGGGQPFKATGGTSTQTNAGLAGYVSVAAGGWGLNGPSAGTRNFTGGFIGGAIGTTSTQPGGGGGGAGPEGVGGGGGNGSSGTGSAGSGATANTGAGGGGGGGGSTAGGTSGAGGSGKLYLEYWTTQTTVVTS